jgi:hypothetical protein
MVLRIMAYSRGAFMHNSFLGIAVAAGFLSVCTPVRSEAQDALKYKFKTGDTLSYETEFKSRMLDNSSFRAQFRFESVWTVTGVDADGKAKITQKIGRLRLSCPTPLGEVRFDSKEGGLSPESPQQTRAELAPFFDAFPGCEITFTADLHGAVSNVTIPKKVLEALRVVQQWMPGTGETFASEGFRLLLARPIQPLPAGPSAKGTAWEKTVEYRMRAGQMKIEIKYADEGPQNTDGKQLERISVKPELTISRGRIANRATIKSQKVSKGFFLFDREAGRLTEYNLTQDVEQELSSPIGPETQRVQSTWTIKLRENEK